MNTKIAKGIDAKGHRNSTSPADCSSGNNQKSMTLKIRQMTWLY